MGEAVAAQPRPPSAEPSREGRKFHRNGKRINYKGFYYHAAEYQRQKQGERKNPIHKIFRSLIEPIAIHQRALRLRIAAARNGAGFFHSSAVLDNEFVRQSLDGLGQHLTSATRERFKAKSIAHGIIEKRLGADFKDEQEEKKVAEVLQRMFDTKGHPTPEDEAAARAIGLTDRDIKEFTQNIQQHESVFTSPSEMKGKLTDEMMYGGLTPKQQELAKGLVGYAWAMTGATLARYALLYTIPGLGVVTGVATGALSRGSRLMIEGLTYDIGKDRGIVIPTAHNKSWISAATSVDWSQDARSRGVQLFRALVVGGAIGAAFQFSHELIPWVEHGIEGISSHVHGALDHTTPVAHAVPGVADHVKANVTDVKSGTSALSGQEVTRQVGLNQIGVNNYNAEAWSGADHGATWAYDVHNEWTDHSMTFNIYDHADKINYFALHMPNNQTAIVDLAHSSIHQHDGQYSFTFDQNDTHDTFTLMDTNGHQIGTITSSEAYKLFNSSGHLAPSTGESSDFAVATQDNIRSLIDFGNYHSGANGALDFIRYGEVQGHGGFGDLHELTLTQHIAAPTLPEPEEHFHSALAVPLQTTDNWEDRGLEWLREHILNDAAVNKLDQVTDFGLVNTDNLTLATQQILEKPYLYAPAILAPYVASGVGGYFYGRSHAQQKPSALNKTGGITAETALAFTYPGMAATAGIGYIIGRLTNRKKKEAKKEGGKEEAAKPTTQPPSGNPPAGVAEETQAQAKADAPSEQKPTEVLPAEQPISPTPVLPAAPVPPTEGVEATQPVEQEGVVPPARNANEGLSSEAITQTIQNSPHMSQIPALKEIGDSGPEAQGKLQTLLQSPQLPGVVEAILKPLELSDEKVHQVVEQIQERQRSQEGFKIKDLLLLGGLAEVVIELAKKGVTPQQVKEVLQRLGKSIFTEDGTRKLGEAVVEEISKRPGFEALATFLKKEESTIIPALESLAPALEEAAPVLAAA